MCAAHMTKAGAANLATCRVLSSEHVRKTKVPREQGVHTQYRHTQSVITPNRPGNLSRTKRRSARRRSAAACQHETAKQRGQESRTASEIMLPMHGQHAETLLPSAPTRQVAQSVLEVPHTDMQDWMPHEHCAAKKKLQSEPPRRWRPASACSVALNGGAVGERCAANTDSSCSRSSGASNGACTARCIVAARATR